LKRLEVDIEIMGRRKEVGSISGESEFTATFAYSSDYVRSRDSMPISASLPLKEDAFNQGETRTFFEGLLPEGFIRRTIAKNNRVDADDYLSLLCMLGSECPGAVSIRGDDYTPTDPGYKEPDADSMYELASGSADKAAELEVEAQLSLPGSTGKIGAYKGEDGTWYIPRGGAASTHIIKQGNIRYEDIVQNERLMLMTAEALGIEVPSSEIVSCKGQGKDRFLLASERYDRSLAGSVRKIDGMNCPLRLHQEDFGQAMGVSAANKYEHLGKHHMRDMFRVLREKSASPIEDQIKLWDIVVFNYLIGNTDAHIKNFSIIYDENMRSARLAPAYDLVSTIIYDNQADDMAFAIGGVGKWEDIDRSAFEKACVECRLNTRLFMKRFDEMSAQFERALKASAGSLSKEGYPEAQAIADRILKKHKDKEKK
jgi:serine/threonine-protein kinase HipA